MLPLYIILAAIALIALLFVMILWLPGIVSAPRGRALRPTKGQLGDPPLGTPLAESWYIRSRSMDGAAPISCSFVEFDERGDYLDFLQHRHAYNTIRGLAERGERVLLVLYVHGWKNNSQSGDVVQFNTFLHSLATSAFAKGFRVHGVYLAWRGDIVPHALDTAREYTTANNLFDEPIVSTKYARWRWSPLWLFEQLGYWNRKGAAEDRVSGISLIRTIYTCAHTARRFHPREEENRVLLIGHSFGALMLEQSFAPASLSALTAEWPWNDPKRMATARVNPLPFDQVLFINSAAPSIYARQFYNYMVAHRGALFRNRVSGVDAPIVISLTSVADAATRIAHYLANQLARFDPSLQRCYSADDYVLKPSASTTDVSIPQWYYYMRTPGHNPLLVSHWVVPESGPQTGTFATTSRDATGGERHWRITRTPVDAQWSSYKGATPVCIEPDAETSGYWIMRCEREIISGHNDIWCRQAMETYIGLFAEIERLGKGGSQTT